MFVKRLLGIFLIMVVTYNAAQAQCYVGLRDNKYAYIGYRLKDSWQFQFDHSIFVEHIRYQYIRCTGGYTLNKKQFDVAANLYAGITYCNSFYDLGTKIYGAYKPIKWFEINAMLNPHFDAKYKYATCYMEGVRFNINEEIALFTQYSTIPEYRISEKRIHVGLNLKVRHLQVTPQLSIPIEGNAKTCRVLFGLKYEIPRTKR